MTRVARLSIAPVRSLGLEHPETIDLTPTGVLEDRRFYVIDQAGRLVDQLIAGRLVQVKAHTDPDATRLRLVFPDGTAIETEVELGDGSTTQIDVVAPRKQGAGRPGFIYLHWYDTQSAVPHINQFRYEAILNAKRFSAVSVLPQLTFPWRDSPSTASSDRQGLLRDIGLIDHCIEMQSPRWPWFTVP